MKTSLRDILLGASLCAVVILAVAAAGEPHERRYSITTAAGVAFVLDAETGQVWGTMATPALVGAEGVLRGSQPGFWNKKNE